MKKMTDENILANLRILYVEDEEMTRNELSRFLKRRTPLLDVAKNGLDALVQFENTCPDILISDLRMPDMDGLELTKRIRDLGYDTPIIITSALSDSETILSAVDRNIVKYLVKPIDTSELERTLHHLALQIKSQTKTLKSTGLKFSSEEKKNLEKSMARDVSALLKKASGKGPKRLRIRLSRDCIHMQINGMLTPMETTLLHGAQSPEALTINRELLYKTLARQICELFESHIEQPCSLSKYAGCLREDKEDIYFEY